jgi:hypothetical protein
MLVAEFVLVLVMGLSVGWLSESFIVQSRPSAPMGPAPVTLSPARVVNLDVIPDWGGATYDAFIVPANANGTMPKPTTNSTKPGPNDNNITVPANVPVTFVITDLDTALNLNFTANATIPFTIYNDTASGQVQVQYNVGELVKMPVSHTFTVAYTDVNIPLPPDTIITFTVAFTKAGVYMYFCTAPCGLGMGLPGYMEGYIIVT